MIYETLTNHALSLERGQTVRDIRIGLRYTAALLDDGACGAAYTFQGGPACGCHLFGEAGNVSGRPVRELIPWVGENHLLKASVGLAAINAVLNRPDPAHLHGNVLEVLSVQPDETFGMIGEFRPILAGVRKMTEHIYVFEQNLSKGDHLYAEDQIPAYLPRCDVVVVTATSIINHTIDGVLEHCRHARQVCLVGPSTPLCPQAFADTPVTLLAGSVAVDPERLLQIVGQAGGTMHMKPAIEQVMMRV